MKKLFTILTILILFSTGVQAQKENNIAMRSVTNGYIPGDNVMRYYRLALPVTLTSYNESFDRNYDNVLKFWQECENFVNMAFVPLGICFDVVVDERLVMHDYNLIDESIYNAPSFGTEFTDAAIGSNAYDVGMWVHYRDEIEENSGLSIIDGAYSMSTKSSGYANTDKWVVAHELGHMFGATHTTGGEGSLMDNIGEYFSYPSIKKIRDAMKLKNSAYYSDVERTMLVGNNAGGNYVYGRSVTNNAPEFTVSAMKDVYKIPQGACMAIPLSVIDTEGHNLTYSAIGSSSANIGDVQEGGYMPHFSSLKPQTGNIVDYRPKYEADIFYDGFFYYQPGTEIPSLEPGSYSIAFLVNDMPSYVDYNTLLQTPFYSNYSVWDATIDIIGGTPFTATIYPLKKSYSAGEEITVNWGVNTEYFTNDSRLRITMSDNYGESFDYILADSVPAVNGNCKVMLPNVNVGNVDVDFITKTISMRGGIIRIEEIGGIAYTLTTVSPEDDNSFNITGGNPMPLPVIYKINLLATVGGKVSISGTVENYTEVEEGTVVTITATPDAGYDFDGWYNDTTFISDNITYTFKAMTDMTITAKFKSAIDTSVHTIYDREDCIKDNSVIYDLCGRRVVNPTYGIYIMNGKKVLIK